MNINIRNADFFADHRIMMEISKNSPPLVCHDEYIYWVFRRCFSNYIYIGSIDGNICGFISAMPIASDLRTVYFWQMGVLPAYRKNGIATQLVERLFADHTPTNFEVNINPDNKTSTNIFSKAARMLNKDLVSVEPSDSPDKFKPLEEYNERYYITI